MYILKGRSCTTNRSSCVHVVRWTLRLHVCVGGVCTACIPRLMKSGSCVFYYSSPHACPVLGPEARTLNSSCTTEPECQDIDMT